MLVKIKVDGFITLEVPSGSTDEYTKQDWLNQFSAWVESAQDELDIPLFDDVEAWIEDIDFLVED